MPVPGLGRLGEYPRQRPSQWGCWRQLQCIVCRGYFLETLGTMFHGKRMASELLVRVIACLAEGLGLRGTARVFELAPNTVLSWLVEAAEQLHAFSAYFLTTSTSSRCNWTHSLRCSVVLPHASVRQALAEPVATNGRGSAQVWRPGTPAMAAGRTDHGWSLREGLLFRVPPWRQPQTV